MDVHIKRITLSVVGGMSIPLLLFFVAVFTSGSGFEWLAGILYFVVGWPLAIYDPIFTPPPNCSWDCGPTLPAILTSTLCDVVVFALLSYAFLSWRNIAGKDEAGFQTLNLSSEQNSHTEELNSNRSLMLNEPGHLKTAASFTDEASTHAQTFARHTRAVG